jgi:cytochrome c556
MKRLITAVSFAVLAAPAAAAGMPYDQNLVDRALPNVSVEATDSQASRFGAPYDQNRVDRALPNIEERSTAFAAAAGNTRSDVEIAAEAPTESPWANDYHFIAPAQ